MKETLGYSLGVRRRVVLLFLALLFVVYFPAILFIRFWYLSTFEKVDTQVLKQCYASVSLFFDTKRIFLEDLAEYCAHSRDVQTGLAQHGPEKTLLETLKKDTDVSFVYILGENGKITRAISDDEEFLKGGRFYDTFASSENKPQGKYSGFMHMPDDRLLLIASSPIEIGDDPAKRPGALVVGLVVADDVFSRLNAALGMKIKVVHVLNSLASSGADETEESHSIKSSQKELIYSQRPYRVQKSETGEGGYYLDALIRDINGYAVGVIRIKNPSPGFLGINKLFYVFLWYVFVVLLFASWFLLTYLSRHITAPLIRLRDAIKEISASKDLSKRLDISPEDEVGGLIVEFNAMLDELEMVSTKLRRSGEDMGVLYRDLLEQKKFTSEILSLAHSIVLVLLPDGRVKFVNDAIERISGYRSEEVIGRDWFDMFMPLARRQEERKKFEEMVQGRIQPYHQMENTIVTKEGQEHSILWNNSLFEDKDGRVNSVLSIGHDNSEYKKAEGELNKKMSDLERFYKVTVDREKVVIELKRQVKELKGKLEELGGQNKDKP